MPGKKMLLKVIACDVFTREICHSVARSPHVVDLEFTPKGAHNDPDALRQLIQEKIDAARRSEKEYDAIALCLGVCGNATVGLIASGAPLVIPRAHDCCTLFLGSKERFATLFADRPSTPFSSVGYIEHGGDYMHEGGRVGEQLGMNETFEDYVEKYGEENATFIWETLHSGGATHEDGQVVFIEMPGFDDSVLAEECRQRAEASGKEFEKLAGSMDLIRKLIFGEWDEQDFLVVKEGESIAGVYDWDAVVKAAPGPPAAEATSA
jgi:hypothetical protein